MKKILIINGPNLNLLGEREPHLYGNKTLADIIKDTSKKLETYQLELNWFQSNIEGEIVEKIQSILSNPIDLLVINPAAYSHTSVAIYDALKMLNIPIIEVHLTNVYRREDFRQTMLTAKAASMIMSGFGNDAYYIGILSQLNKG